VADPWPSDVVPAAECDYEKGKAASGRPSLFFRGLGVACSHDAERRVSMETVAAAPYRPTAGLRDGMPHLRGGVKCRPRRGPVQSDDKSSHSKSERVEVTLAAVSGSWKSPVAHSRLWAGQ